MDQTTIFIKNILIVIIILFTVLYVPKFNYKILNLLKSFSKSNLNNVCKSEVIYSKKL